jgi:hypothetical protein
MLHRDPPPREAKDEGGQTGERIPRRCVRLPTVLFSAALLVVAGFWLLVLLGGAEHDSFDGDADIDAIGIGGVPVTVAVSLLIAVTWFTSLTGTALLHWSDASGALHSALALGLLVVTLLIAWGVTRLLVRPLAKLSRMNPGRPGRTSWG